MTRDRTRDITRDRTVITGGCDRVTVPIDGHTPRSRVRGHTPTAARKGLVQQLVGQAGADRMVPSTSWCEPAGSRRRAPFAADGCEMSVTRVHGGACFRGAQRRHSLTMRMRQYSARHLLGEVGGHDADHDLARDVQQSVGRLAQPRTLILVAGLLCCLLERLDKAGEGVVRIRVQPCHEVRGSGDVVEEDRAGRRPRRQVDEVSTLKRQPCKASVFRRQADGRRNLIAGHHRLARVDAFGYLAQHRVVTGRPDVLEGLRHVAMMAGAA
jgi:hypothetical protein